MGRMGRVGQLPDSPQRPEVNCRLILRKWGGFPSTAGALSLSLSREDQIEENPDGISPAFCSLALPSTHASPSVNPNSRDPELVHSPRRTPPTRLSLPTRHTQTRLAPALAALSDLPGSGNSEQTHTSSVRVQQPNRPGSRDPARPSIRDPAWPTSRCPVRSNRGPSAHSAQPQILVAHSAQHGLSRFGPFRQFFYFTEKSPQLSGQGKFST
ncbi:hypothetical protein CRG98_038902 [Punica granatum]|uniref:Uncharacterized protein n=1 Tax=Punica granatum TaxID=22663 RepID=A0A2I0I9R7_PUNGR|nr:hypothetical protein CRG98_038902 [Punica granatum]